MKYRHKMKSVQLFKTNQTLGFLKNEYEQKLDNKAKQNSKGPQKLKQGFRWTK